MDKGYVFTQGVSIRPAQNESFILSIGGGDYSVNPADRYFAFSNIDDLFAFLLDEKDAFAARKKSGQSA